jgi:RNA polymerase sigma-70 factor (sigma-E family)
MDLDVPAAPAPPRSPGTAADAVTALYREHSLGLVRLAHIMLGSRAAAEDVVQEAFCGLYRRWAYLTEPAKALGYVRSAVLNGCRSSLRRGRQHVPDAAYEPAAMSAEAAVLSAEERRAVLHALRGLPARQREVLALRYYLDLTDSEIALDLGISQSTVRSTMHRALAALGHALGETP